MIQSYLYYRSQVFRIIRLPTALLTVVETLSPATATFLPFPFPLNFAIFRTGPTLGPLVTAFFYPFMPFGTDREEDLFSTFKTLPLGLITLSTA